MGTIYYLWRDDTETAFELGKLWDLAEVFDSNRHRGGADYGRHGQSNVVREEEIDTLAELMTLALWGDGTEPAFRGTPNDQDIQWMQDVARKIFRWSDGQPFRFVHDQSSELERAGDKEQQEFERVKRLMPNAALEPHRYAYITGSIYQRRETVVPRPRNAAEQRRMVGSHYWLAIEMLFHNIAVIASGLYVGYPARGILGGYERGLEAVESAVAVR